MKVTLGANIDVWREDDLFYAGRAGEAAEPQTCFGVDLFEVMAGARAARSRGPDPRPEAVSLAERAKRGLRAV